MPRYTERKAVRLSEEQWNEMKQAVEENKFSNDAEYVRAMVEAGKSNIAAMDPRTSDTDSVSEELPDDPGEAARLLPDTVLIEALEKGENNKQGIESVLSDPVQEFESELAHRLDKLAEEETSPVGSGRDPQLKYWLEEGDS